MKKLVKDSNWYEDIKKELYRNDKFSDDIKFVSNDKGWCAWQEFLNMKIVKNYWDDIEWVIVGDDWYIDYTECDGECFWEFKRMPKKPLKRINIKLKIYN